MSKLPNLLLCLSSTLTIHLCLALNALASPAAPTQTSALTDVESAFNETATVLNNQQVAFFPPANGGGSMIDFAVPGAGEPLNVIISGLSDPSVLTDLGFLNWAQSIQL
jgi:hypothetical protein